MDPINVTEIVTTAMTSVSNDIMTTLASVAPIALGIFGSLMALRYGKKFFKVLAG